MQVVKCKVKNCGFCSINGFCLNRLVVINEKGLCDRLSIPGWERSVQEFQKSTYRQQEKNQETESEQEQQREDQQNCAGAAIEQTQSRAQEERNGPPRD